jgi:hypothetical protein
MVSKPEDPNMNNRRHENLKTYIVFTLLPHKLPFVVQDFK